MSVPVVGLNAQEAENARKNLPLWHWLAEGEREEVMQMHRAEAAQITNAFREYLENTYASEIPAAAYGDLYAKAEDDEAGLPVEVVLSREAGIEQCYSELAALLTKTVRAVAG